MALLHSQSRECVKSESDLFSVPPIQTSVGHGKWVEHHPLATMFNNGAIELIISGPGEDYLEKTLLYVRAQIMKAGNLPEDAEVGPTNLWLHSLFKRKTDFPLHQDIPLSSLPRYIMLWNSCQGVLIDSYNVVQRHCGTHGCNWGRQ